MCLFNFSLTSHAALAVGTRHQCLAKQVESRISIKT